MSSKDTNTQHRESSTVLAGQGFGNKGYRDADSRQSGIPGCRVSTHALHDTETVYPQL